MQDLCLIMQILGNPTIKPSVRKQVLDGIQTFTKFGKVVKYILIGSNTNKTI